MQRLETWSLTLIFTPATPKTEKFPLSLNLRLMIHSKTWQIFSLFLFFLICVFLLIAASVTFKKCVGKIINKSRKRWMDYFAPEFELKQVFCFVKAHAANIFVTSIFDRKIDSCVTSWRRTKRLMTLSIYFTKLNC